MNSNVKFYAPGYQEAKTYGLAFAFVFGNILFPQLFHLIPKGGMIFLPIYFFTLVGAYKFGWKVGLLTAVFSPLINSWLFGMPAPAVLPIILVKSTLLALAAGWAGIHFQKATLPLLIGVVVFYQLVGGLAEWAMTGSLEAALQDWRLGFPGMLLQIFGAWAVINLVLKK